MGGVGVVWADILMDVTVDPAVVVVVVVVVVVMVMVD